jgi:uncharacterized protein (DUF1778 family)
MAADAVTDVINSSAPPAKQALIDPAAPVSGKNRRNFLLDDSREKRRGVLADRTHFRLSRQALQRFNELIEAPLTNTDALRRLLSAPAPWERESLAIGPHLMAHTLTGTR